MVSKVNQMYYCFFQATTIQRRAKKLLWRQHEKGNRIEMMLVMRGLLSSVSIKFSLQWASHHRIFVHLILHLVVQPGVLDRTWQAKNSSWCDIMLDTFLILDHPQPCLQSVKMCPDFISSNTKPLHAIGHYCHKRTENRLFSLNKQNLFDNKPWSFKL